LNIGAPARLQTGLTASSFSNPPHHAQTQPQKSQKRKKNPLKNCKIFAKKQKKSSIFYMGPFSQRAGSRTVGISLIGPVVF
jgi:hypothetical protein